MNAIELPSNDAFRWNPRITRVGLAFLLCGGVIASAQIVDPAAQPRNSHNASTLPPMPTRVSELDAASSSTRLTQPWANSEPVESNADIMAAEAIAPASPLPPESPTPTVRIQSALTQPPAISPTTSPSQSDSPLAGHNSEEDSYADFGHEASSPIRVDSVDPMRSTHSDRLAPASSADVPVASALPRSFDGLERWIEPARFESSFQAIGMLTIFSLAPAILLMTTSFVRISVVLGLLRQAIGTQMLPSNQIITSLSMFLTLLVMGPVWKQVYDQAIVPYSSQQSPMSATEAWQIGIQPVREFMSRQIEMADNSDDILMFYDYLPGYDQHPESYDEVPLEILLPAYMLSELKIAFLIGFQIYLPFLVLDLVVSSVTVSMGMMMLPPAMVALPLKLLLFVLVDGWQLVMGMLLQSFGGFS